MAHSMSRMASEAQVAGPSDIVRQQWLDQGIRTRKTYITVWYCCDCGNGPMLLSDSCSGSGCSHYRCSYCTEEEIEETTDDYILQAALQTALQAHHAPACCSSN
ncbi:uncharacterized protein SPSK_03726 [Sporothrix schenckii 1099-18]|nr:uncharacterized protein SPSK_03726 [Sporothrix schenckii 1099-18]KJR82126.1 hypothetical protein SPSK_03726 [Sporothrix schenckii 1099-18]